MHGGPSEVIGIDNNESALFVQGLEWATDRRAHFFLCDLRDARTLGDIMANLDIVLHSAALKHVVMCERSPMQAVEANITGLQNVINASTDRNVEKLIFTSSDKAVNPNSVMGLTKLMGERMISAANANRRGARTIFSSTRFGNVIGSNGSVFHIFRNQIASGQPGNTHPSGNDPLCDEPGGSCRPCPEVGGPIAGRAKYSFSSQCQSSASRILPGR